MNRIAYALLALTVASGCTKTRTCKSSTVLLTLSFDSTSAAADQVQVDISVAGGSAETTTLSHSPGSLDGTIEIDFSGKYPTNAEVSVTASALSAGAVIGTGSSTLVATPGCATGSVDVSSSGTDMAMGDGGTGADFAGIDLAGVVTPSFFAAQNYGTGKSPAAVDVGDFDGDGHFDFVVANGNSASISVFLNDGTGHFGSSTTYSFAANPSSVAVGDFDGKKHADVAVLIPDAAGGNGSIRIMLNDGTGHLVLQTAVYAVGVNPTQIRSASLAGGTAPDLAVVNAGGNAAANGSVTVYLNQADGSGSFLATPATVAVGNQPFGIVVGNFIGLRDIAVLNSNSGSTGLATVTILKNGGNGGSYTTAGPFATGIGSSSIATADLDNKNGPDLVVAGNSSNGAIELLNNGAGGFGAAVSTSSPISCVPLLVDLNGDAAPDLFCGETTQASVQINKADGTGGLLAPTLVPVGSIASAAADVNGDGSKDVITMDGDPVATVLLNTGKSNGALISAQLLPLAATVGVAVGDFNGDSKLDFVVASGTGSPVSVSLGDGAGNFGTPAGYSFTGSVNTPTSVAVADFNHDLHPDVVVGNHAGGGGVAVFLNKGDGTGTLNASTNFTAGTRTQAIAVADFDGTNGPDIATTDVDGNLYILLNNGSGSFGAGLPYATTALPNAMVAADLNQDGSIDVAVEDGNGGVVILYNNGAGVFTAMPKRYPTGANPFGIAVGDLMGDGVADDLVTANFSDGTISVFVNKGDKTGTFTKLPDVTVDASPRKVAIVDVEGDGKADILVTASGTDNIDVLWNRGANAFLQRSFAVGETPDAIVTGKFNADGLPDVLVASGYYLSVLLNTSK